MKALHYRALLLFCLALASLATVPAFAQQPNVCTDRETWVPMNGLPGRAVTGISGSRGLYVLHTRVPNPLFDNIEYTISVLENGGWSKVADLTFTMPRGFDSLGNSLWLEELGSDLFVAGRFQNINDPSNTGPVARWDGTAWQPASTGLPANSYLYGFKKLGGDLYTLYLKDNSFQLAVWDGSGWKPATDAVDRYFTDFTLFNGELYIATEGGNAAVKRWDGTAWQVVNTPDNIYSRIFVFNGALHVMENNQNAKLHRLENGAWVDAGAPFDGTLYSTTTAVQDGMLYVAGTKWPGGTQFIASYDGTSWLEVTNFNARPDRMIPHNGTLYAVGSFTYSCDHAVPGLAYMCTEKTCGSVAGTVYRDDNANCTQDGAEYGLRRHMIEVEPGGYHMMTDDNGNYQFRLPAGAYTLKMTPYQRWSVGCPATGSHDITLAAPGESSPNNHFGLRAESNVPDIRVSLSSGLVRSGRPVRYGIMYENVGTQDAPFGMVRVKMDPLVSFDSATPAPSRIGQNGVEWDFQNLKVGEDRSIVLWGTVSRNADRGTMLCAETEVMVGGDDELWNNRDSGCVEVTGSYDPNDMTVTPIGLDGEQLQPWDSVLTYMVRFQNTGNDTAFEVVVIDTLSGHLDISTLQLGATSHPYTLTIGKQSTLIWRFANIMLPDSFASEKNSHGFLKFSVQMHRNLPSNTQILNRAAIYFDFNAPIITNTVTSVTPTVSGVEETAGANGILVQPNPARDLVRIEGALPVGARIELQDMLGRRVREHRCDVEGTVIMDTRSLPPGMYMVVVHTNNGRTTTKLNVVR